MKLTDKELKCHCWQEKGYKTPIYDRAEIIENTKKNPVWVHFGAGNIFRGFPARLQQNLIERGLSDRGIIVGEGYDYEIISDIYNKHDNLTLLVTLKANGTMDKEIIASVTEAYPCDYQFDNAWKRFIEIFENPSLQIVSFTITEKGYALKNSHGEFLLQYLSDFENGPGKCKMFLSRIAELLLYRFKKDKAPIALLSLDNCSHNGEKLEYAIKTIASKWVENGFVEYAFLEYLKSDDVSFPWSMIDKITPRPDASVAQILSSDGFEDTDCIITSKNTYIAPFVNAEETEYLVVEDDFPNGRPPLENSGVYFTDRDTVNKVEKMKVCTCLNPLHTVLAIFGCLLGYKKISDEMKDADIVKLLNEIGYSEGLPVVVDPGIITPKSFLNQVLNSRFPNPFITDTPQRIATDTSQKLAIRFGETIKSYIAKGMDINNLKHIPVVFAGWLRYCMAIDDNGVPFIPSPDPLLEYVQDALSCIYLGYKGSTDGLDEILSNDKIFGVNLIEAGLAYSVKRYFGKMIAGVGSVRSTIHALD